MLLIVRLIVHLIVRIIVHLLIQVLVHHHLVHQLNDIIHLTVTLGTPQQVTLRCELCCSPSIHIIVSIHLLILSPILYFICHFLHCSNSHSTPMQEAMGVGGGSRPAAKTFIDHSQFPVAGICTL